MESVSISQAVVLAIVQGVTEFLPVSSSGHLVLTTQFFGWSDQGLTFDVAIHFGTLLAVLIYFRRNLLDLLRGTLQCIAERKRNEEAMMVANLAIATIPVVVAGLILKGWVESFARSWLVVGVATIVFGVALLLADRWGIRQKDESNMPMLHALYIGVAQAIALIPGTSRSGITITCALALGYTRVGAARFSFLLAIPTILGATVLSGVDVFHEGANTDWATLGVGIFVSFVCAYLCIDVFLRIVERIGMSLFVIYRLMLGSVVLVIWYLATIHGSLAA